MAYKGKYATETVEDRHRLELKRNVDAIEANGKRAIFGRVMSMSRQNE